LNRLTVAVSRCVDARYHAAKAGAVGESRSDWEAAHAAMESSVLRGTTIAKKRDAAERNWRGRREKGVWGA